MFPYTKTPNTHSALSKEVKSDDSSSSNVSDNSNNRSIDEAIGDFPSMISPLPTPATPSNEAMEPSPVCPTPNSDENQLPEANVQPPCAQSEPLAEIHAIVIMTTTLPAHSM